MYDTLLSLLTGKFLICEPNLFFFLAINNLLAFTKFSSKSPSLDGQILQYAITLVKQEKTKQAD